MIDQSFIDRVALALVKQMLSLDGQIKGKHYTDDLHAVVINVRGEERIVGYEESLASSPHWQSMAEAAIGVMGDGSVGVELVECSNCHAAYQLSRVQRTSFHCPNCKSPDGLLRKAGVSKS